jgi:hypothetical protein
MLYEMDLFRHAAHRLVEDKWQNEMDKWVCLEGFLLHFRNLIEFFGRTKPRPDDLSILKPERFWRDPVNRPAEEVLQQMHRPDLWEKYEDRDNPEKISRYLQHCTEQRVEPKNWEIGEMFNELYGLLDGFERLLPDKTRTWVMPALQVKRVLVGSESAGTNTVIKHS